MGIVRFALRLPHTFYVLAALIVFLGTAAILTMPIDIFPEINIPVVNYHLAIYRAEHSGNGAAGYDVRGV
jgi:multidrug efflux pump subunit AcrB